MKYPYIPRSLGPKIRRLFANFSCIVMVGARQVGKSTLLHHLFPTISHIAFDSIHDVGGARNDPELFLNNNPCPLILEEIQYAPELVPIIKRRIDTSGEEGLYILTSSQQWGAIKQIAESLAGRAIILNLASFSLIELGTSTTQP